MTYPSLEAFELQLRIEGGRVALPVHLSAQFGLARRSVREKRPYAVPNCPNRAAGAHI